MGRKDLTQERQDAILDATERCIAKYGLQRTTLENIASEAKINRGLIHHYIGNREDVVQLMAERLLERYQNSFDEYARMRTESNRSEIVLGYYFNAWFEQNPEDDILFLEMLAQSGRDSHIRKLLLKLYNGVENTIAKELTHFFPDTDDKKLHSVSYSLMVLAFAHATISWLGLPQAKQADVRSVAANLVQSLR
ncbi:MAG: TetR/AcrR family transcriptional regulator [Anaerolineales bacterium]|nr:TetR/AcrR family transcriptional regulator [Anaerolineales bacterium]